MDLKLKENGKLIKFLMVLEKIKIHRVIFLKDNGTMDNIMVLEF
jgi:hypothetical protein